MTVDELRRKSNMGLRELRELEEMQMGKCKPGDIITIKGTEFAVLDIEKDTAKDGKDKLFVLLKEPTDITEFGTTNDYGDSALRKEVGEWCEKYVVDAYDDLIYPHEVSLLTMDGRKDYGTLRFLAAPLTFDEWRKYSRYIPNCEKGYWLATGDGAPGRRGAAGALCVSSNGDWYGDDCSNSYAVRPALVVSEELIDTPKDDGLSKFSTMELIQELAERSRKNERVLQE